MKKMFHRQLKIFKLESNQYSSIIPNFILRDIQIGSTYALIETYQRKKFLVQLSQLTNKILDLKTFFELNKELNGKFVTLIGEYLYIVIDNKISKILIQEGHE